MVLCASCKKEMTCQKSGIRVIYCGGYHIYSGDRYACGCGNSTIVTNPTPWNPENPVIPGEFDIVMS